MGISIHELAQRSNIKFGTSGLRGLVDNLTDEVCFAYTKAFLLSQGSDFKKVAIGHDLRPSSPQITKACIAAIESQGLEPIYLGALPTPAIAYYCLYKKIPGIVVTGSHIPFDRNGIKFYRTDGEISKTDEEAIMRSRLEVESDNLGTSLPAFDREAIELYQKRYIDFFGTNFLSGKTIAIYQHSSVARDFLDDLFQAMGAKTLLLGRSDEFVPIDTEAVREDDINQAKQWAKNHSFDILISTDGDADRPLIADEHGEFIRGDILGILTAEYLQADHVVTPVNSNTAVELTNNFKSVMRTKIGSPFVINGMNKLRTKDPAAIIVGYEANGGFLLETTATKKTKSLRPLPTRDAILPMLAVIGLSLQFKIPVSKVTRTLPHRYTFSDRLQNFPNEASAIFINELINKPDLIQEYLEFKNTVKALDQTDGLRFTLTSGDIIHLRPSGNAPELRVYAESCNKKKSERIIKFCIEKLNEYAHMTR